MLEDNETLYKRKLSIETEYDNSQMTHLQHFDWCEKRNKQFALLYTTPRHRVWQYVASSIVVHDLSLSDQII